MFNNLFISTYKYRRLLRYRFISKCKLDNFGFFKNNSCFLKLTHVNLNVNHSNTIKCNWLNIILICFYQKKIIELIVLGIGVSWGGTFS